MIECNNSNLDNFINILHYIFNIKIMKFMIFKEKLKTLLRKTK